MLVPLRNLRVEMSANMRILSVKTYFEYGQFVRLGEENMASVVGAIKKIDSRNFMITKITTCPNAFAGEIAEQRQVDSHVIWVKYGMRQLLVFPKKHHLGAAFVLSRSVGHSPTESFNISPPMPRLGSVGCVLHQLISTERAYLLSLSLLPVIDKSWLVGRCVLSRVIIGLF